VKQGCYEPAEIAAAGELAADHPLRRHVAECPACRAVERAYREFLDPTPLRPEGELAAADAELAKRLERQTVGRRPIPRIGPAAGGQRAPRSFGRSLLALAATLAVAAGVLVVRDIVLVGGSRVPVGPGVDRGAASQAAAPLWDNASAVWRIEWSSPDPTGDAVVVFFDARMRELTRVPAGDGGSLELTPDTALAAAAYVQVLFVNEGDTVTRSSIVGPR
jgi:hypothetical protein